MSDNQVKTTGGNERLQLWLNFVKFLLGTVALGVVTLMVNSEIQRQRLEFEIKSKENEFIAQFVDNALDENPEKRRDFAEYFVRLSPTDESRNRWKTYRDYTQILVAESQQRAKEIDEQERKLLDLTSQLEVGKTVADFEIEALQKEMADLQAELSSRRRELAAIRSEAPQISPWNQLPPWSQRPMSAQVIQPPTSATGPN